MSIKFILDKLKTFVDAKFGDIFKNNEFSFIKITKNIKNVIEVKDNKTLLLDLSKVDTETRKKIKEEILDKSIFQDDEVFLSDNSSGQTSTIKKYLPAKGDELLKFYQGKLSPTMYKVLEAALMVRNASNSKEDIGLLKSGVAHQYPEIGNNMCNLASRGYFEDHFKKLYESMAEEEDFDILKYQEKVKYIVKSLPYIIFVNRHHSYDEISGEVKFKLERLRKYGAGKLVMHALSKVNVGTTLKVLSEYDSDKSIRIKKDMNKSETIITATLIF